MGTLGNCMLSGTPLVTWAPLKACWGLYLTPGLSLNLAWGLQTRKQGFLKKSHKVSGLERSHATQTNTPISSYWKPTVFIGLLELTSTRRTSSPKFYWVVFYLHILSFLFFPCFPPSFLSFSFPSFLISLPLYFLPSLFSSLFPSFPLSFFTFFLLTVTISQIVF